MSERDGGSEEAPDGLERLPALEAEFQKMLEERFLDGLVRRFEKLFPGFAQHVEDVLFEEVVRLVEGAEPLPRNVRAVLTWRLRKRMLDVAKRPRPLGQEAEEVDDDTPERRAIRKEMFDRVKGLIDAWPNPTMALVVRLTLEAAYYDEILEVDDVKEIVAEQLGHELTTANVWKLRSRGLRRLAAEVARLIGEEPDDWDLPLPDDDELDEEHSDNVEEDGNAH